MTKPSKKPKRDSLWPLALAATAGMDFKRFLDEQAVDLKRLVNDAFDVEVDSRIVENVFIYNFTIILPQQDYHYLLFSLRAMGGEFPARVVAPHMREESQVVPVNTKKELEAELRNMFHDERTLKIVNRLVSETKAEANFESGFNG